MCASTCSSQQFASILLIFYIQIPVLAPACDTPQYSSTRTERTVSNLAMCAQKKVRAPESLFWPADLPLELS